MKLFFCSALLLMTFSLSAQAPVPLAHGDVPGEPHHHLKIENEYVRAYYVEVPPHEDTLLHQHDNDYLFVTLGATEVINAVLGKPEIKLALKDGEVRFTRGGFAHVARNLGDEPFRNVTIELLKPQGEAHNRCAKIIDGPLDNCPQEGPTREAIAMRASNMPVPMFETGEALVTSGSLAARAIYIQSGSQPAQLLVALDDSGLRVDVHGKSSMAVHRGEVLWIPTGAPPTISSLAEKGSSRFLLLAFKNGSS